MNVYRDQLIDTLLAEHLGADSPPDLTDVILRRAFPRRWWKICTAAAIAAAAAVFLAVMGWLAQPASYPKPSATGDYEVVGGGSLQRGATLRTRTQAAQLSLGDYVKIQLKSHTQIQLAGKELAERLKLDTGQIECAVDSGVGSFKVETQVGTVAVVGTRFNIQVVEENLRGVINHRMIVSVTEGKVKVSGRWGTRELQAGQRHVFDTVEKWTNPTRGTITGLLTARGETFIEIRPDGERESHKYFARWIGGTPAQKGGPEKAMLKVFNNLTLGSRLEVDWYRDERLRAVKVKVLQAAPRKTKKTGEKKGNGQELSLKGALAWLQNLPKLGGVVNKGLDPDRFQKLKLKDLQTLKEIQIGGHVFLDNGKLGGHVHLPSKDYRWLTALPALEKLRFPENDLNDEALVFIGKIKTLKELHLMENKITNAGLRHLTGLKHLTRLDLRWNKTLTDECIPHLVQLTRLQELNVFKTGITANGIQRLQKALPMCKVIAAKK